MPVITRSKTIVANGRTYKRSDAVSMPEGTNVDLALPIAQAGTLTTRTDADTGVITMDSVSHGYTTSDFLAVFWTDADGVEGYRINMDITAVAGALVTVDLGFGDDLPIATTEVAVGLMTVRTIDIDGTANGLAGVVISSGKRGCAALQAAGTMAGTDLLAHLTTGSPTYDWLGGLDGTFGGPTADLVRFAAANGDTTTAATMALATLDT